MVEVFQDAFKALPGPRPSEEYVDYMPTVERETYSATRPPLLLKSLPVAMKACHHYSFTRADKKRRVANLLGVDRQTIAAVRVVGHRLPGLPGTAGTTSCKVRLNTRMDKEADLNSDTEPDSDNKA